MVTPVVARLSIILMHAKVSEEFFSDSPKKFAKLSNNLISRGCVGIEPTQDRIGLPRNGFEDRTPHQQCSIPICIGIVSGAIFFLRSNETFCLSL